jgi:hypothetical protein
MVVLVGGRSEAVRASLWRRRFIFGLSRVLLQKGSGEDAYAVKAGGLTQLFRASQTSSLWSSAQYERRCSEMECPGEAEANPKSKRGAGQRIRQFDKRLEVGECRVGGGDDLRTRESGMNVTHTILFV